MQKKILDAIDDGVAAIAQLKHPHNALFIERGAEMIAETFRSGNKLLIAGNGGSLCDASHFAEELTGFFRQKRQALPAIALSEPGHLTCVGNDLGFDYVFSRSVEALGQDGDLFVGLTTSGNSANLIHAFAAAQKRGLKTLAFLGKGGGKLKGVADLEMVIEGFVTSDRIQEAHMASIHIMIEIVEAHLFHETQEGILEEVLTTVARS